MTSYPPRSKKMARSGVTYLDVTKVAEKLRNKGVAPTIDRVREILGTGSKTTLAHHLKRWKESTAEELEYQTLPTELARSVKNLYEQLQTHAVQKIEEIEARSQKEIDQLLQQLKQEEENAGAFKKNILNLESSNNKFIQQISILETSLAELKQINTDVIAEKNELAARIQEKTEQISTLKDQLRSVEHNSEHYREMLKQQRDEEKMQFAHQLETLQQENNINKAKIIEANNQITAMKQENFELQSKVQYFEKLYTNKVTESDLLSNKLLLATAKQEELINNLIKMGHVTGKTIKNRKE
jgi:chromosome segregation ATPase